MLTGAQIARRLKSPSKTDPLVITPAPEITALAQSGAASVDLRLGTWFSTLHASRMAALDVRGQAHESEAQLVRMVYIPFGESFVLHPGAFALAVTLEWIRLPHNLSAEVIGKSAWGRHGLSIATATAVHPTFTGCLTLEMSNVGSIPIRLYPGMLICQIFLHELLRPDKETEKSVFVGHRRPVLGAIRPDAIAKALWTAP
jgi:dCTP deaminase